MASVFGSALRTLGQRLPGMGKSIDDVRSKRIQEEKDRKESLARMALLASQTEASNLGVDAERTKQELAAKARGAAGDYQQTMKDSSAQKSAFEVMSGIDMANTKETGLGEQSPLPENQYDNVKMLEGFGKKSGMDQMKQFGLPQMAGYDPGVESMVKAAKGEDVAESKGILSTYYNQKKDDAIKKVKIKYPDLNEDEVFDLATDYMNSPSFMTQSGDRGLERMYKLKKTQKLGGLAPEVVGKEAGRAATIEGAKTPEIVKRTGDVTEERITKENETKKGIPGSYKQSQYTAATFANRMKMSEDVLTKVFNEGYEPSKWYNMIKSSDSLNAIKDPQQRQYAQAMRNFINATLRRESGAAIAPSEFDSANKQYFAMLNDDPETLSQKQQNRLAQFDAFRVEAGGAYDQIQEQKQTREADEDDNKQVGGYNLRDIKDWLEKNPDHLQAEAIRKRAGL